MERQRESKSRERGKDRDRERQRDSEREKERERERERATTSSSIMSSMFESVIIILTDKQLQNQILVDSNRNRRSERSTFVGLKVMSLCTFQCISSKIEGFPEYSQLRLACCLGSCRFYEMWWRVRFVSMRCDGGFDSYL